MGAVLLARGDVALVEQVGIAGVVEVDEIGCGYVTQAVALAGVGIENEFHDISLDESMGDGSRASSAGIAAVRRHRRLAVRW